MARRVEGDSNDGRCRPQHSSVPRRLAADVRRGPESQLRGRGGDRVRLSGLPIGFFNVALLTGEDISGDRLEALGRAACDWAADKNLPWLFVVTHETLQPGVDAAAAARRLRVGADDAADRHARAAGRARLTRPGGPADRRAAGRYRLFRAARCQFAGLRHGPRGGQARDRDAILLGRIMSRCWVGSATRPPAVPRS